MSTTGARKAPQAQALLAAALLYGAVAAGTLIGGVLRALASLGALAWLGPAFPWGTLVVNVTGSFVIGFYGTLSEPGGRKPAGPLQRQFVMTGICGGFTTFSIFSLEALRLAQTGAVGAAEAYTGGSAVAWLAAVWLGHVLAARSNRPRGG